MIDPEDCCIRIAYLAPGGVRARRDVHGIVPRAIELRPGDGPHLLRAQQRRTNRFSGSSHELAERRRERIGN